MSRKGNPNDFIRAVEVARDIQRLVEDLMVPLRARMSGWPEGYRKIVWKAIKIVVDKELGETK